MIVKNESDVIERCLASILPHVDAAVIVDTGSTDDTVDLCFRMLGTATGLMDWDVICSDWNGFAESRNEALEAARVLCQDIDKSAPRCPEWNPNEEDWLLFTLDADEIFEPEPGFQWPTSDFDGWHVWVDLAGVRFTRTLLTKASTPWRYEGELHEDVVLDRPYNVSPPPPDCVVRSTRDGARAKNPNRYAEDAARLRAALAKDPNDPRTVFYLANSLRDAGQHEEALAWYDKRAAMTGLEQETWACLHERARCMILAGKPAQEIVEAHLMAINFRPSRAETVAQLAMYFRLIGMPALDKLFADVGRRMAIPDDVMFVDRAAYGAQARIGIISAPRDNAFPLPLTITAAIASDCTVAPGNMRVFWDSTKALGAPVAVSPNTEEGLAEIRRGGIYGTLNLCRALEWTAQAPVCVVLEDDVLFARDWLQRATAILETCERSGGPTLVNIHHMHGVLEAVAHDTGLRIGQDAVFDADEHTWPNGSQGLVCRPDTARRLASMLREHMAHPDIEERKAWAMDVGILRACRSGVARMVFSDPCLLMHNDAAPSTWASKDERWLNDDNAHRMLRQTRRFRPC